VRCVRAAVCACVEKKKKRENTSDAQATAELIREWLWEPTGSSLENTKYLGALRGGGATRRPYGRVTRRPADGYNIYILLYILSPSLSLSSLSIYTHYMRLHKKCGNGVWERAI